MQIPSTESARAMAQEVLRAHLCQRYHDLASWASEPLKQRLHYLARPDGSNLKDLLMLGGSTSSFAFEAKQTQVLESMRERWSPDQSPLAPPDTAIVNCSSWDTAPVFRRDLDSETVQALIPVGNLVSLDDLWGIVLLAEAAGTEEGRNGEVATWKYHHLIVLPQKDLLDQWTLLSGCHHYQPLKVASPIPAPPLPQQHTLAQPANLNDDDDSDDDYWGQYGDPEDSPTEGSSSKGFARGFVSTAAAANVEDDDDDEEYWGKYAEEQTQSDKGKKQQPEHDHHPLDLPVYEGHESHGGGSETRRILACVPESSKPAVIPAAVADPGQVDPTTLTILLEKLVTDGDHGQDESAASRSTPAAGRDNDIVDGGADNDKSCDHENDAALHPLGLQANDESLHLCENFQRPGIVEDDDFSASASASNSQSWNSSASTGSRSRSQSFSTSISSTSSRATVTTAALNAASTSFIEKKSNTNAIAITSGMVAQEQSYQSPSSFDHGDDNPMLLMLSSSSHSQSRPQSTTSPMSAISSTDSAFYETCFDDEKSLLVRNTTTATATATTAAAALPDESVRQSLRSVVRKASVSGMSKEELLEMLNVIYEDVGIQA